MRKVYKIDGKTEAHEVFRSPSGKTTYKVTFSKGNLDPKNRVPARCITDSPIIQAVIESSPKFNRTIFLEKVYADAVPVASSMVQSAPAKKVKVKAEAPKAVAKAPELREMPDVNSIADAATALIAEGAAAADIDGTVEGAHKVAKGLGISFPNLKE